MRSRIFLSLFFWLFFFNIQAQTHLKPFDEYIAQYAWIATEQQKLHGIPASITLAQGLIESGAGKSVMAKESNNHFGIKCHSNWNGETTTYFDDGENACFRKYKKVEDSYEDHSKFLVEGKRYAFLFDLNVSDYKGWAMGLQKAGYATDRTYAEKLIRVIETYNLNEFAKGKTAKIVKEKTAIKPLKEKRKVVKGKKVPGKAETFNNIALKYAKDYQAIEFQASGDVFDPLTNHEINYMGTTPYIVVQYGDNFSGIAEEYGISTRRIRSINEFPEDYILTPGESVYLDKKANWWEGDYPLHRVLEGDNMHSISQKYGLQLNALYKLNNMKEGDSIVTGQKIKLRNPEQMSAIIKAMSEAFYKKDSIR